MKKTLLIVLALVLVVSLAACGSSSAGEIQQPSAVTVVATGDNVEDAQREKQQDVEQKEQEEPKQQTASIDEMILVDEAGVKITAKSLEMDAVFGPEIKLLIENESGKDLTFQCRNASVNGYMVETMMSVDVVNGKKANDSLTFMESSLKVCGIDAIAEMEFMFHIFDTAEWETIVDTDVVSISF